MSATATKTTWVQKFIERASGAVAQAPPATPLAYVKPAPVAPAPTPARRESLGQTVAAAALVDLAVMILAPELSQVVHPIAAGLAREYVRRVCESPANR